MAITKKRFYRPACTVIADIVAVGSQNWIHAQASLANGRPARNIQHTAHHQLIVSAVWLITLRTCGAALRRQIFEPLGQLLELPFSRQRGRFAPGRPLPAEARQSRLAVHGGDRSEYPQILGLRGRATCLKSSLQRAARR